MLQIECKQQHFWQGNIACFCFKGNTKKNFTKKVIILFVGINNIIMLQYNLIGSLNLFPS